MPALREVHEELENVNSKILAINITSSDKIEDVTAFVDSLDVQYPVLLDEKGDVSNQYGIRSIPTVVVIDKNGVVAEHHVGPYEKEELLKLLENNR